MSNGFSLALCLTNQDSSESTARFARRGVPSSSGILRDQDFGNRKRLGQRRKKAGSGLIVSDVPATVAGLFTTNKVCAAPVKFSAKVAARGAARAIVVNSGNANACTGAQGMRDAKAMALAANAVTAACIGILPMNMAGSPCRS